MPCLLSKLLFQENTLKGSKTLNMKSLFPRGRSLIEKEFKSLDLPGGSEGKESACNAGDPGSIPRSGISLREGTGCPLQYSCLDDSMDRRAWRTIVYRIAKGQTWLKQLSTHAYVHGGPTVCSRTKNLWMHAKWWAQPQRRASVGLLTQQSEKGSP